MYKIFSNQENEIIEANIDLLLTILSNEQEVVVKPSNAKELGVLQEHCRNFNFKQNYDFVCKNYLKNNEKYLKRGDYDR